MKKAHSFLLAVVALLALVGALSAQQEPINPKQVALLRWYPANLTTSFQLGSGYGGGWDVAFDGANVWVTREFAGLVSKLRASDGAVLGTFAAECAGEIAFDGANIWVTNHGGNTVTKLRASDGANLGVFFVGSAPYGVAFDGASMWVAYFGGGVGKMQV